MKKLAVLALLAAAGAVNAQIVTDGDLTNGLYQNNSVGGPNTVVSAPFWSFWTFSANAGDNISIDVNRLNDNLDPVSSVVFGDANGIAFGDLTGTSIFNWSGPGLSAVLADGDDEHAHPGPFGDPFYGFVAADTGVYTIAVASYGGSEQLPFEINVTGSTVPTPGAMALLGLGGLVATRRRRA